jgi:hypothetical protein
MCSTTVPVIVAYATSGFYRRMSHLHRLSRTTTFLFQHKFNAFTMATGGLFTNIVQHTM